jgi:hypothetical protein
VLNLLKLSGCNVRIFERLYFKCQIMIMIQKQAVRLRPNL